MKKGNQAKPVLLKDKVAQSNPPPKTTPTESENEDVKMEQVDKDAKMDIEHKTEAISVEQILRGKKECEINLDDSNKAKKKRGYDLDDMIIRDITLSNDVHMRLISNINGYFVDIRKYFRGFPSQKGIRIAATKFDIACDYLRNDIKTLNLQYPRKDALQAGTP